MKRHPVGSAVLGGLALTALAATRIPLLEFLGIPGVAVAAALGFGNLHDPGPLGIGAWILTVWLGTFLVWTALSLAVLEIIRRFRAA